MSLFSFLHSLTPAIPAVFYSALFAAGLMLVSGVMVKRQLAVANGGVVPDEGFTVRNGVELLVDLLKGMAEENMGPEWRKYFPLVGTLFLFILISNYVGLVPGIDGATSNPNTTWAWAIISFVAHQYVAIQKHGFGYIYHFLGPALFDINVAGRTLHVRLLAPIYIPIELISQVSRVFTLAVRLLANMFADHQVVGVWLLLVPAVIPAVFMGLGTLIAFLQAYVFAMLSMIYIGLALEEAH